MAIESAPNFLTIRARSSRCLRYGFRLPVRAYINVRRDKPLSLASSASGSFFNAGRIFVSHSSRFGSGYSV
ncbi:MAG TPA: hypothetical protein VNJ12_01070, partial [Candidatus Dormibacteraeota bacterium]|nr:hypothetical protein [Candidatus Dormibacteraeota bacterium]